MSIVWLCRRDLMTSYAMYLLVFIWNKNIYRNLNLIRSQVKSKKTILISEFCVVPKYRKNTRSFNCGGSILT